MQQRVQMIRRRQQPSSAAQLPITAALHAENLTLLIRILHHHTKFVNPYFPNIGQFIVRFHAPDELRPLRAVVNFL